MRSGERRWCRCRRWRPHRHTWAIATICLGEREGAHALGSIAQLLKRVFDIDIQHCLHCGGQLKLIAAIEDPAVIQRNLTHLGLASEPFPRPPAVRVDLFEAA